MPRSTITIQQTGKIWKFSILIGTLALVAGIWLVVRGFLREDNTLMLYGGCAIFAAFLSRVVGYAGAWWYHA